MATPLKEFEDLDTDEVFLRHQKLLQQPEVDNFVVDFGKDKAQSVFDVPEDQWESLIGAERPPETNTRWISIWGPDSQQSIVKHLGKQFGFSPRLLGIMRSEHPKPPSEAAAEESRFHRYRMKYHNRSRVDQSTVLENGDIEMRAASMDTQSSRNQPKELDISHYKLVDEVWHFSSVDWGERYLCLGYNSVQTSSETDVEISLSSHGGREVPKGKRIWSWLIICEGGEQTHTPKIFTYAKNVVVAGTVISIYEDIFSESGANPAPLRSEVLMMRRNVLNVFRQLSNSNAALTGQSPISILGIRRNLGAAESDGTNTAETNEVNVPASLLFHYLFDDWYSSYGLVARQEHQYGRELFKLREKLLDRADLEDINGLHHVGRQLAVLKRIYQSYKTIIDRILERQKQQLAYARSSSTGFSSNHFLDRNLMGFQQRSGTFSSDIGAETPSHTHTTVKPRNRLGVILAQEAISRFERLRDRISLYALSEIQDCIDEKESMVFMTFNLIAMKESQAVERLTRITILLAKVTILFLPVSLMTAYFSIQIEDLVGVYTHKTYWGCFGVVMGLSLLLLIVFGLISDTVEGKMIYRSLSQQLIWTTRTMFGRQKAKWK
ncbi:MAG: hypothetical protein M4579_004613 [Chaenotheca gracillima]|nr:MAG: hypothetical protein M4579_004613 [Chaenotheca gracillima]